MAQRIFISAASREFEAARDVLANGLRSRGVTVEVQSAFRQTDDTTLAKLHAYIRGCDRVLALVGDYSGAFPPDGAVTPELRAMLPNGVERASYTQWEVIFARHYNIPTFLFESAGYPAEQAPAAHDDPAAQAAWRDLLFDGGWGRDRRSFASTDQLRAEVMELQWPNAAKPSNLWRSIGKLFKGREDFLAKIEQSFRENAATAIVGTAMHGLGGVGKTRAAIEYGHTHKDDYSALFFLVGKSPNDLLDGLADLCGVLELEQKDAPDLGIRVAAVINWMKANPGWFLVIDNVDDPAAANAVREFLDQVSSARGHVLITSRLDDWGFGVEPLQLDLLSTEAAMEVLREATPHRTCTPDEDAALARLAEHQLGCLSLALVQAAAFIEARRISFAKYAEEFDRQAATVLARFGETEASKLAYPKAVAQTWLVTFEQLGEPARLLLDMLAWLSIEPIPRSLWDVWPQEAEVDLEEGLTQLARFSFVRWEESNTAITMHRLVQEVARDLQSRDEARRDFVLEALFAWLKLVNVETGAWDMTCWPMVLPLLPHVLRLFGRTKTLGPFSLQPVIYREYGLLLMELARYGEAETLLSSALEACIILNGEAHSSVADHANGLARLFEDMNRLEEAERLYGRALGISIAHTGRKSSEVAGLLSNIAGLRRACGHLGASERLYRYALRILENSPSTERYATAVVLNNLGSLLEMEMENYEQAEILYRRSLAIDETIYAPDHTVLATRLNNLAGVLSKMGRKMEAEPLCHRSAAILLQASKACGHLLPNLRHAIVNYVQLLFELGRSTEQVSKTVAELMVEYGFDPAELLPYIFTPDAHA